MNVALAPAAVALAFPPKMAVLTPSVLALVEVLAPATSTSFQGLTLVRFSAQPEHFLRSFVTARATINGLIAKEMLKSIRKVD